MSDRILPSPGDYYRHYKGKIAMILGVAESVAPVTVFSVPFVYARPIDVPGIGDEVAAIEIRRNATGAIGHVFHYPDLVVYACSGDVWCRTIDNFMETLEDKGVKYNRFRRLGELS